MPKISTTTQTVDSLRLIEAEIRKLADKVQGEVAVIEEAGLGPLEVKHFKSLGLGLSNLETFVGGISAAIRDHRLMRGDFSGADRPPEKKAKR